MGKEIIHIIATRCNYSNEDLFIKRFPYLINCAYDCLLHQTCKNFQWIIITNNEGVINCKFDFPVIFSKSKEDYKKYINFLSTDSNILQSRLDIDDALAPEYVQKMKDIEFPDNNCIIDFSGYRLDERTQKVMKDKKYNLRVPSPFLSLYTPKQDTEIESVFDHQHTQMAKLYPLIKKDDMMWFQIINPDSALMGKRTIEETEKGGFSVTDYPEWINRYRHER